MACSPQSTAVARPRSLIEMHSGKNDWARFTGKRRERCCVASQKETHGAAEKMCNFWKNADPMITLERLRPPTGLACRCVSAPRIDGMGPEKNPKTRNNTNSFVSIVWVCVDFICFGSLLSLSLVVVVAGSKSWPGLFSLFHGNWVGAVFESTRQKMWSHTVE